MSPLHRSILLLVATMTIWGATFAVTKEVIAELPSFTLSFARVLIGALVLAPLAIARQRGKPPLPWRVLLSLGFVGVAFYYAVFTVALEYISAVQGALVQSSIPAAIALVAVLFFGERATPKRWFGIVLSIIGVLIVFSGSVSGGGEHALLGNLLMFVTVLTWGLYTSLAKKAAAVDATVLTASIMGIGAAMLAPISGYELAVHGWPTLSAKGWAGLLYLGAMASGVAYVLYNDALKHMDASQAAVYANLIPIVGVITGIVLLGETLTVRAIVGGIVVMIGVWVAGVQSGPTAKKKIE